MKYYGIHPSWPLACMLGESSGETGSETTYFTMVHNYCSNGKHIPYLHNTHTQDMQKITQDFP
jgi:hypothetical protein